MMPTSVASGMAGAEARISQIQTRLEQLTGVAITDLAAFASTQAEADRALAPQAPHLQAGVGPAGPPGGTRPATTSGTGTVPAWAAELPPPAHRWIPSIERAAAEAGIEPTLLAAVVRHESNFEQSVVSHAGAIGLGQLMPGTAAWLGVDPHDPEQNLTGAARYLREQLDRFGTPDLALAAYNAGPNRVAQAGGIPRITETQLYVERVLSTWEQLR